METIKRNVEASAIKAGIITFFGLVGYFFLMKLFGLSHVLELRFLNFIILATGITYGIVRHKKELHENDFYLQGLAQGVYVAVISVGLFAAFMAIYLSFFDLALLEEIKFRAPMGFPVTGLTIFGALVMEGMASGAIISFIAMQYLKTVRPGE
ncbi:MAG TPA: hypothetical protein VD905_05960 [Flavobacteriales bacterium]|nr:hypothetical protein [Flavobacteriales bacterium]